MVVSMNSTEIIDEVVKSSASGDEGFTGIASVSSQTNNVCRSVTHSAESTEADTTYENYFVMKTTLDNDDKSAPEDEDEGVLSKQLKELINLQLDLIEYQQVKITNKDKQIMLLKSEKEQLEARICRMERRLALQKRQIEVDENQVTKSKIIVKGNNPTATPATPTTGVKNELQRYDCHLPVTVTSRTEKDFKFRTYLRTNLNYLDISDSKFLQSHKKPSENVTKVQKCESVSVPSWKVIEKNYVQVKEPPEEDITNDAFCKRHLKPELEEKRRKRWDLQHLRQQQQHEHLTEQEKNKSRRGNNVQTNEEDSVFTSLYPNPENVMAIEINNTVPVCVFGYPAPAVSIREMELPWFSIAKREVQVRQAKEKLMKKTLMKKGYSSSKKKYSKIKSM